MKRNIVRSTKGKIPPRYRNRIADNKRLWRIWNGIKRRCLAENDQRYHQYGGRGIKIDPAWLASFDNFAEWAFQNGYDDSLTIERIDVNGDYCPENCKWITLREQAFNKRDTIWVDYEGRHVQLRKICNEKGLHYDTIHNRITDMGWDAERAINTPLQTEGSLMSECRKRGLNYGTVHDRIVKLGWTREEALAVPTGRGRHGRPILRGNLSCACEKCGSVFEKKNGCQRFCSDVCREEAKKERKRKNVKIFDTIITESV